MIVPLVMTLWFSFQRYNLLEPRPTGFAGLDNYTLPGHRSGFLGVAEEHAGAAGVGAGHHGRPRHPAGGAVRPAVPRPRHRPRAGDLAVLRHADGQRADLEEPDDAPDLRRVRLLVAPRFGLQPVDWFADYPLASVIAIVSWEWLPFALLILLTAVQSLDHEQREAARMDGAGAVAQFFFITLPHLSRAIGVVMMIETIFLLTVFAEIFVTTSGGPGNATTNLAFLIYAGALLQYDIGGASAGGVVAIVLANIVAFFLVRTHRPAAGGLSMQRRRIAAAHAGHTVLGWGVALLLFFPIAWMVLTSFKSEVEAIATPPHLMFTPTLDIYAEVQARRTICTSP